MFNSRGLTRFFQRITVVGRKWYRLPADVPPPVRSASRTDSSGGELGLIGRMPMPRKVAQVFNLLVRLVRKLETCATIRNGRRSRDVRGRPGSSHTSPGPKAGNSADTNRI
jgi:hypothetical protein